MFLLNKNIMINFPQFIGTKMVLENCNCIDRRKQTFEPNFENIRISKMFKYLSISIVWISQINTKLLDSEKKFNSCMM